MSPILILMGLLVLSYLGSVFTFLQSGEGGKRRGAGLASGSEFLILGVMAGPLVFRAVTRESLATFDPIAYCGIAWLALSSGLEYGYVDTRRVRIPRVLAGISMAVACGALIGAGVWYAIPYVVKLELADRVALSFGLAIVGAETTRNAAQWLTERYGAKGPLTDLLSDLAHSDEIVPIVAVALLFALRTPARATVHLPPIGWAGATIGVGLVLGVATAMLLARDLRVAESWGTILGTALMTIGLAARLDLAAITAMFALGATIAWVSRHRGDIRAMVVTTERSVLLPALVLAGARIDPMSIGRLWILVGLAVILRVVGKVFSGFLVRVHPATKGTNPLLGLGLLSSGGMSVAIGLAIAMRFSGRVGDAVLAMAVVSTVLGEITAAPILRRTLMAKGEIVEPAPEPPRPAETEEGSEEAQPVEERTITEPEISQ
ncbi:MAG: cation:proton antiporter [Polyangiales bacterium]